MGRYIQPTDYHTKMFPLIFVLLTAGLCSGMEQPQPQPQPQEQNKHYQPQFIYPEAQDRTFPGENQNQAGGALNEAYGTGPGTVVSSGPWVTVPNGYQPDNNYRANNPFGGNSPFGIGASAGFGIDTQSVITWGLGAVIVMLLISTGVQIVSKVLGLNVRSILDEVTAAEGRSLETVSNIAQFAFEALEKYEQLNSQ